MRTSLEVADIFRAAGPAYRAVHAGHLSITQLKVMTPIENCRTAALGGHVEACDDCGHWRIAYNSCRNRHCPKCQKLASERWIQRRKEQLLPVQYFHTVFTLPDLLNPLTRFNQKELYGLLFKAASETLLELAAFRQRATALGIRRVEMSERGGYLDFTQETKVNPAYLVKLLSSQPRVYKMDGPTRLRFQMPTQDRAMRLKLVDGLLTDLANNSL